MYNLINLFIHSIIVMDSNKGYSGASAKALGVIWINNKPQFSQQDIIEMIIHEFVHNLCFIDEISYIHYSNYKLMLKKENLAEASPGTKKPLKDVIHRIVVLIELIMFRLKFFSNKNQDFLYHAPTSSLILQAKQSINSIYCTIDYKSILSERSHNILKRCQEVIKQI